MDRDEQRQLEYYDRTAEDYDAAHIARDDEHERALAILAALTRRREIVSILDVGAGTGRAMLLLEELFPSAEVVGVEPVAALRERGRAKGLRPDRLTAGDAMRLDFPDGSFDLVVETGMLHHVRRPRQVVSEMIRVARQGVLLSDANKFGQGGKTTRRIKALLDRLGLWTPMIWATTRGRMSKWSEGDGLFYSYSVFDDLEQVRRSFPRVHIVNTVAMEGDNLRRDAPIVAAIALRD